MPIGLLLQPHILLFAVHYVTNTAGHTVGVGTRSIAAAETARVTIKSVTTADLLTLTVTLNMKLCKLYCRTMVCIARLLPACGVRLSVRLSVTFVICAKTNKDIFEIFSPCGSQAILVFPCQTGWRYSNGNPLNGGVECKGV